LAHEEVAARTAWRDDVIVEAGNEAIKKGSLTRVDGTLISTQVLDDLKRQIIAEINAHHKRDPLSRGLPKEIVRERFFTGTSPELFRALVTEFEKAGAFIVEKEIVRIRDHRLELSEADARLRDSLDEVYRHAGLAPPTLAEALSGAGVNASAQHGRRIFQLLIDSGALVKVHGDMFFHRDALDDLIEKLRTFANKQTDGTIDVAGFKSLTGISRKYAIPLLEYLDRRHVTRREGDRRVIT